MDSPSKRHTDDSSDETNPKEPWFRVFKYKAEDSVHVLGPPGRLLMTLLLEMDDNLIVRSEQSELATKCFMSRSTVSRHLAEFEEWNLCVTGRGKVMMNPDFALIGYDSSKRNLQKMYNAKKSGKKRG